METMPKRHYPGGKIVLCSCLHAASLHVLLAGSHYIDAMQGMHVHACLPLQLVAQTCKCLRDRILKTLTSAIVMSSMIPADVDVRVTELLAGASTGDKLVNTVHQIMVLLRENGLVTSMRLLPSAVGVHPKNRDGTGLNSADVHTLLSNLLEVGFVAERTHCVAIEPANEQELDWNHQLVGSCQGLLGFMKPQTLKALSLCGSHTNFALRIIADGAPHEGPESQKVTVGGRLDGAGGQGGCSPSRACPAGLELGGLVLIRGPSLAGAAANDSSGRKCHTAEIRVRAAGAQEDIPTHRFAAEGRHPIGLQHHQEEGTLISACLWQFLRPPLPVRSEAPYSACLVSPAGLLKLAWQVLCCMHACELLLGVYCIF